MPRMRVRADVFDADGCIFNKKAAELRFLSLQEKDRSTQLDYLLAANTVLFNWIKTEVLANKPDRIDVMCGSNRQSFLLDHINSLKNSTDRFFPVLNRIVETLKLFSSNVSLDPLLLADIFSDDEPGSAFNKALVASEQKHFGCPFDDTKMILIYTILQHLANKHGPGVDLEVNFYDDRFDI